MFIKNIQPTNRPAGLNVVKIGLYRTPPAVGSALANANGDLILGTGTIRPISGAPFTIPADQPSQSNSIHAWDLVAIVDSNKVGVYTIQGLIVSYRWLGSAYRDYFPGQMTLATGRACANLKLAPPPQTWH